MIGHTEEADATHFVRFCLPTRSQCSTAARHSPSAKENEVIMMTMMPLMVVMVMTPFHRSESGQWEAHRGQAVLLQPPTDLIEKLQRPELTHSEPETPLSFKAASHNLPAVIPPH